MGDECYILITHPSKAEKTQSIFFIYYLQLGII